MTSAAELRSLHQEISDIDFGKCADSEIATRAEVVFDRYSQLHRFAEVLAKVREGGKSSNQALVGFDEVRAEMLASTEGVASILMRIFKPVSSIGSVAQNSIFRVIDVKASLVIQTFSIRGYSTDFDIQRNLSLELQSERSLVSGDIAILRPGPYAYKFKFDPPGAIIHRLHQPSTAPFSHSFDANTLAYIYSNFSGQEGTRDQFFSVLLRGLTEHLVELYQACDDQAVKVKMAAENEAIMDFLQKFSADREVNAVTRWGAVQTLSLFRPERALETLRAMREENIPNIRALAANSSARLEAYLTELAS